MSSGTTILKLARTAAEHSSLLCWDDLTYLRACIVRYEHGDHRGWRDFFDRLQRLVKLLEGVTTLLVEHGWIWSDLHTGCIHLTEHGINGASLQADEAEILLNCLNGAHTRLAVADPRVRGDEFYVLNVPADPTRWPTPDELPTRDRKTRTAIMYIEEKPDVTGPDRIGRVTMSRTRRTLYYWEQRFQSLRGTAFLANYCDVDTGDEYWISNCRRDGRDALYPGIVEIDDDVREEYWLSIRKRRDMVGQSSFRSEGKYTKRGRI